MNMLLINFSLPAASARTGMRYSESRLQVPQMEAEHHQIFLQYYTAQKSQRTNTIKLNINSKVD